RATIHLIGVKRVREQQDSRQQNGSDQPPACDDAPHALYFGSAYVKVDFQRRQGRVSWCAGAPAIRRAEIWLDLPTRRGGSKRVGVGCGRGRLRPDGATGVSAANTPWNWRSSSRCITSPRTSSSRSSSPARWRLWCGCPWELGSR